MNKTLLPPVATKLQRDLEAVSVRADEIRIPARDLFNPATCPVALLPWLAWALSVDTWDSSWSETQKRAICAGAIETHRRKGTVGAIKRALSDLGFGVEIVEWFQMDPPGDPYTFDVELTTDQVDATAQTYTKVLRVIDAIKNLRSHNRGIKPQLRSASRTCVAGVTLVGDQRESDFGNYRTLDGTWNLQGIERLHAINVSGL